MADRISPASVIRNQEDIQRLLLSVSNSTRLPSRIQSCCIEISQCYNTATLTHIDRIILGVGSGAPYWRIVFALIFDFVIGEAHSRGTSLSTYEWWKESYQRDNQPDEKQAYSKGSVTNPFDPDLPISYFGE